MATRSEPGSRGAELGCDLPRAFRSARGPRPGAPGHDGLQERKVHTMPTGSMGRARPSRSTGVRTGSGTRATGTRSRTWSVWPGTGAGRGRRGSGGARRAALDASRSSQMVRVRPSAAIRRLRRLADEDGPSISTFGDPEDLEHPRASGTRRGENDRPWSLPPSTGTAPSALRMGPLRRRVEPRVVGGAGGRLDRPGSQSQAQVPGTQRTARARGGIRGRGGGGPPPVRPPAAPTYLARYEPSTPGIGGSRAG
jgi:hypothetical protein